MRQHMTPASRAAPQAAALHATDLLRHGPPSAPTNSTGSRNTKTPRLDTGQGIALVPSCGRGVAHGKMTVLN